ncbi:MAG: class I SAM-dependent methyltransferase [Burkholderiales bacterium]|nr:class I SAM-dependent methyltransferase [Burkholderiales bacterium]
MAGEHPAHTPASPDARHRLYAAYVSSGQAGNGSHRGRDAYLSKLIRRHAPANRDALILDLACGHGALIRALKCAGYRRASGVDLSAEQVALAQQSGLDEVEVGDLLATLMTHTHDVDAVFLLDVLEHQTRDELLATLDGTYGALRRGGRVIMHVPNAEGLHGMRVRYGDLTHEQAFTPASMRQLLTICGFTNIRCYEDRPVMHGLKSAVRSALWYLSTLPARLQLLAETGTSGHILSQNMLVVAETPSHDVPASA